MRTKKKDEHIEEEGATPVSIPAAKTAPTAEKTLHSPSVTKPVKLQEPIPEDQQRELFKWMLEEKGRSNQKILKKRSALMKRKPFSNSLFERNLSPVSNYLII